MKPRATGLHEITRAFGVAASMLLTRARAWESLADSAALADLDRRAPEEVGRLGDRLEAHTQTLQAMGAEIQATLDRTFEESRFDRGYVDDQVGPPR